MQLATWHIQGDQPRRIGSQAVPLERDLEDWIEHDPSIVDEGLTVIGRQISLRGTGRLDLLAVDQARRLVVIEVKPDALHREVLAQGLDYASTIASMPGDELRAIVTRKIGDEAAEGLDDLFEPPPREVQVIVVGTGTHAGLERLSSYLGKFEVPIRAVALHCYDVEGHRVLVREAAETQPSVAPSDRSKQSVESALAAADTGGIGTDVRRVLSVAEEVGLKHRGYKRSVMITPPSNRNRALITLWPEARGGRLYCAAEAFEEFLEVPSSTVRQVFGPLDERGNRDFNGEVATQLCDGLRRLLQPSS